MPYYLIQAAYGSDAWAGLIQNPHDRAEAIRPGVEGVGGRIIGLWYSFGEYDLVGIFEMPSNVDIAAFMVAAGANRGVKAIKTTPLLTMEDGMEAMRKAPGAGYRPPS